MRRLVGGCGGNVQHMVSMFAGGMSELVEENLFVRMFAD